MAGYICYMKYTQQGVTNIKASPERIKEAKANVEKAGGKFVGIWVTFGRYDMVAVIDVPNDYVASTLALGLAALGNVTTETVRALSEDEFSQVVQRLP